MRLMSVFDIFFGCWHRRYSFPITMKGKLRRSPAAQVTGTHVVCLDCGREFPYDWNKMKRVKVLTEPRAASSGPVTVLQDDQAV
jgi:hypothetical protein